MIASIEKEFVEYAFLPTVSINPVTASLGTREKESPSITSLPIVRLNTGPHDTKKERM